MDKKITDLDKYLVEIGQLPLLSKEELQQQVILAKQDDATGEVAKQKVMDSCQRFVVATTAPYRGKVVATERLIEVANEELESVIGYYDVDTNPDFLQYAVEAMRWKLKRTVLEHTAITLVPQIHQGNEQARKEYMDLFLTYFDWDKLLAQMTPEDEQWVWALVNQNNYGAMACLLYAMNYSFKACMEDFIDEDTGETVSIQRYEIQDAPLFPADKYMMEKCELLLCKFRKELSDEALSMITRKLPLTRNTFILLNERVERGDKDAIEQKADMYLWGEEVFGIYINKVKAKELYDQAGVEYNPDEDEDDDDPHSYEYTLTGTAEALKPIKTLIDEMAQKYGQPDNGRSSESHPSLLEDGRVATDEGEANEFGLFIPLGLIMKALVGTDVKDYRGNILHFDADDPERFVLTIEANGSDPLFYALQQCFAGVAVEVKGIGL